MNKIYYNYTLDKLVKNLKFVPYRLKNNANHEVGKFYWSSYWQQYYKVLNKNDMGITVLWGDGKKSTHCTPLDIKKDYELKFFESFDNAIRNIVEFRIKYNPINSEESLTAAEIKALCCAGIIDVVTSTDLYVEYFNKQDYKPNDYTYYFIQQGMDYKGIRITRLKRDLNKSPKKLYSKAKMNNKEPGNDIEIKVSYPNDPNFKHKTRLIRLNLDKERENDILHDKGFIVSPTQGIKDVPFGTTGWIVLNDYYIISPAYYKSIEFFIGKDFQKIIKINRIIDEDGNPQSPFNGYGMSKFKLHFDEIMEFYLKKNKGNKQSYYDDIMEGREKVFTQSIPVVSNNLLRPLRPFDTEKITLSYESTNAIYNAINKYVSTLNSNSGIEDIDQCLEKLQYKVMELYDSVIDIISSKKGTVRTLLERNKL